jgi:type VI secretion system protein VasJ
MVKLEPSLMKSRVQEAVENTESKSFHAMLLPIDGSGVGEDPQYSENFITVKNEIDRLANANYVEVVRLCEQILTNESKDLRVAGYYLLAKVYTEGVNGLHDAVKYYLALLKGFSEQCHPQRENAKLLAISWLNNDKLATFVKSTTIENDEERSLVPRISIMIDSLNSEINAIYGEQATPWNSLKPWIEKNIPSTPSFAEEVIVEEKQLLQESSSEVKEIASELAFTRLVENAFGYLANRSDWLRLIAMSRALRWSSITLPKCKDGITRLSPPRESIVIEVQGSVESEVLEEKLTRLESFYMESGCQFYFDMQKHEADIAKLMGRPDISKLIEFQLKSLIERKPRLLRLTYSDGTPFASEATRRWISKPFTDELRQLEQRPVESEFQKMLDDIVAQADKLDIAASIERLEKLEIADQSEFFRLGLVKLELCMNANRDDLALPIAEYLEEQVTRYSLYQWNKSLALQFWSKLLHLLQKTVTDKKQDHQRIEDLKKKICTTDLAFALRVFQM